ncbi:MAG: FKBP-type peptidyl-prolyl cis-trans isomerase [Candidatus Binatia bacterium]
MRKASLFPIALITLFAGVRAVKAAGPALGSDEEKTIYALGLALSHSVAAFNLTPPEVELMKAGLTDGLLHRKEKVELHTYRAKIQQLARSRAAATAESEKKAGQAFLAKAAAQQGAVKTSSGLVYQEITPGTGLQPKATDKVKVHYTGRLIDGTVFDSSVERGQPATFPLNGVIKCWTEGLQLMKVGGKSKLVCPSDIAYGERGSPPKIKPGATLVFEVQLLDIVK